MKKRSKSKNKSKYDGVSAKKILATAALLSLPYYTFDLDKKDYEIIPTLKNIYEPDKVLYYLDEPVYMSKIYDYDLDYNYIHINNILNFPELMTSFPIPKSKISFDVKKIKKYFEEYECSCKSKKEIMNLIYDTYYISFEDLLYTTNKTVNLLNKTIKTEFDIYLLNEKSSDFWMSKMVYNLLDKKPNVINKITPYTKNILIIDDMIYSGNQKVIDIKDILEQTNNIENIYIMFPFASSRGILNLKRSLENYLSIKGINLYIFVGEIIDSNINKINNDTRDRIIFDHKIADSISIPTELYEFGNCKNNKYIDIIKNFFIQPPYKHSYKFISSKKIKPLALSFKTDVKKDRRQGKKIIKKIIKECKDKSIYDYILSIINEKCGSCIIDDFQVDKKNKKKYFDSKRFKVYTLK